MAKKTGRPTKDEGESGTKHVRVYADLAVMLSEILEVEGGTAASFLDPLIRPQITVVHAEVEPEIKAIQKAREKASKRRLP